MALTLRWWNLVQTFTLADAAQEARLWPDDSGASYKTSLWPSPPGQINLCLTEQRPSFALQAAGLVPEQQYVSLPTCKGIDDALLERLRSENVVHLAPCVMTWQVHQIADRLEKEGIRIALETACPHGRIFHWNTRVGMRDLFLAVPELANHIPVSLVCLDSGSVEMTASRLGQQDLLVKSNFALGGAGSIILRAGAAYQAQWLERIKVLNSGKGKKAFAWAWKEEPYVVETVLGDLKSNISVTLDAFQNGVCTEIIGVSEQVITDFSYQGIRSLDIQLQSAYLATLKRLADALGASLAARGFAGWFNLDFVLTRTGQCFLVDLNVRRSAPLDLHFLLSKIEQRTGRKLHYLAIEYFATGLTDEAAIGRSLESAGLHFDGAKGVLPLRGPLAESGLAYSLPILILAEDEANLGRLEMELQRAIGN